MTERLSAEQLAARPLARGGRDAVALDGVDAIVEQLAASCAPGDVVVTLSNGGFGGIWEKLLARLDGESVSRSRGRGGRGALRGMARRLGLGERFALGCAASA